MDQALKDIIAQWVERKLDETEQARAVSPHTPPDDGDEKDEYTEADIWADLWEESTEQLEENRLYIVADLAKTLLQGLQLEPPQLRRFQRELLKAKAGLYREETQRARGDYSTYLDELRQTATSVNLRSYSPAESPRSSVAIGEAFTDYMREHNYREGQKQIETTLRHYLSHAGLSLTSPLSAITKPTITSYKKTLLGRNLKVSTVNKELIHIGHFLKWAKAHDLVTIVATDGLRISGKAQAENSTKKLPFSLQQMTTLRLELEKVRQRVKDGKQPGWSDATLELGWVCLASLYTAGRSAEIWKLHADKVCLEDGIWYLDFGNDKSRNVRVKNRQSIRRVPVHSDLMKAGFLDFVEAKRSVSATGRLFPMVKHSSAVSMFFRRIMRRAKIDRPELTLHSVRHTYATEFARLNVPDKVAQYLTGHAMGHDVHSRVYMHYAPELSTLKEALEKVRF